MKKTALIFSLAIMALILGLTTRHFSTASEKTYATPLPAFSLLDLSDQQHNISEWKDKVLVINFWATWCTPCLKEIPDFVTMQTQYEDRGLQFIGIALDDKEPVAEFASSTKINFPILLGGENGIALAKQLGNLVQAVPYTIIVNRKGQIIHTNPGELSKERLLDIVKPLLQ